MFVNEKIISYQYNIKQVNEKIRYYQVTLDNAIYKFPSVTTILSYVKDSKKIEELKATLSKDVWEYVTLRGVHRGTTMHRALELFLIEFHKTKDLNLSLLNMQNKIVVDKEISDIYTYYSKFFKLGFDLFYNFWYNGWFDDIKHVIFLEMPIFSLKYQYAGTTDGCYINKMNQLVVNDFKSSTSVKSENDIEKYKMQISAYMQALYEMYNVEPAYGEILIAYDNKLDIFKVPFKDRFLYLNDDFITKAKLVNQNFKKLLT